MKKEAIRPSFVLSFVYPSMLVEVDRRSNVNGSECEDQSVEDLSAIAVRFPAFENKVGSGGIDGNVKA